MCVCVCVCACMRACVCACVRVCVCLGNIDQAQYCDRIKGIIELLGSKLSLDELSKIWKIQVSFVFKDILQISSPSKLHEFLTLFLRNILHWRLSNVLRHNWCPSSCPLIFSMEMKLWTILRLIHKTRTASYNSTGISSSKQHLICKNNVSFQRRKPTDTLHYCFLNVSLSQDNISFCELSWTYWKHVEISQDDNAKYG